MSWGKQVEGQMTRLRNVVLGGLAALAIGGAASSALAMESGTFENRLNGATIGLPLGALPPPGLYTGLETAYLGLPATGTNGHSTGNQCVGVVGGGCANLPAIANAVPLLYVPGWNFLGATYAMSVVQAFYTYETCGLPGSGGSCAGGAPLTGSGFVYANTLWNPIALSWNLGAGWFVSVGFNFVGPDGSKPGGQFTPNPDYWTFEPTFAVAYLANNWNLAANFFYDINTQSTGVCCAAVKVTNGNALYGDLHALYKFGKWSIGPVGYFQQQTTADTGCPVAAVCGRLSDGALGGLVGYDFGPVDLQVWVTDTIYGSNTAQGSGGINVWTRLGFRLWAPEAPKPLVAKN
jgi:hypothetical protein